jgi:hypothetical protein
VKASPPGALQFQDLERAFAAGDPNPLRARGNDGAGLVATFDNPRAPDLASLAAQFDLRTRRGRNARTARSSSRAGFDQSSTLSLPWIFAA